jgi:hypothetical protein
MSLYFHRQSIFLKKYVQEWFSKWWSNKYSKDPIFSTNISVLRHFLLLSLTPVSFSSDTKRSIPEVKASFLSHVTAGIYCRYILLIYVIYRPKYAPTSTLHFAFILSVPHLSHIQQSLHNFLFKLTRRWSLLSHFPFLISLGTVVNIHTTKFRIKNFYFQPTHCV